MLRTYLCPHIVSTLCGYLRPLTSPLRFVDNFVALVESNRKLTRKHGFMSSNRMNRDNRTNRICRITDLRSIEATSSFAPIATWSPRSPRCIDAAWAANGTFTPPPSGAGIFSCTLQSATHQPAHTARRRSSAGPASPIIRLHDAAHRPTSAATAPSWKPTPSLPPRSSCRPAHGRMSTDVTQLSPIRQSKLSNVRRDPHGSIPL